MSRSTRLRRFLGAVLAVIMACTVAAAPAGAAAPPEPGNDPFYQPPAGFESTEPGTVLRSRPVDLAAFALLPQKVQAWQLLYRTTDTQDRPQATVTTVLLPWGAKPDRSRPLLSYQVAEDSAAAHCAPSYQWRQGAGNDNIVTQAEILLVDAAVKQGWAVTVPDYEGPDSAYVAGKQAGQAVLDGIRAAQNFPALGLDGRETDVGLWGYSGGALASGWASELHPGYAPELDVKGVAEGGLPVNVEHVLDNVNGSAVSGLAMSGIAGLSEAYPELAGYLDANLTPEGREAFAEVKTLCNPQAVARFPFKDIYSYFSNEDPLNHPVARDVLAANTMGKHTPTAPLLVYHSVNDQLIPHEDVDGLVDRFCADGAQLSYRRDILSEHVALTVTGAAGAINWLKARFAGEPSRPGCDTETVASSLLSPQALATFGSALLNALLALLGQPIR
ncbi:lipase family protein [Amycolatopsis cihanbeyliensis]|uniref:Secretory lipase n=1 Tax=Amycolatopsis cihanbeyliensis TaxID=1128664 RepID=A0A542DNC4_AMYCI|nr:lipase family protein [Amycolatopsis cihanbeyliensis]TQJ04590.1 secretory lipase [Amycolatopsis cihanbeyliensis]